MSTLRTAAQGASRYENNQARNAEVERQVGRNLARRSQRTTTAPRRFQNNQARNAEVAAARAATKTTKRKRASESNILPKANAQAKVFAILDELSVGKNEKAYNMLYSIYRDASSTFFNRVELDEVALRNSIERQYNVINNNIRPRPNNIRQGGDPNANKLTINLSNYDNKINFCLLMWLDMSHDGTLGADGMNFESFLQSSVLRTFLGENPTLVNNTVLMKRMLDIGVIQEGKSKGTKEKRIKLTGLWPGNQFENKVKTNLPYLFDVGAPLVKTAEVVKLATFAVNRENKPIYVSIDSESEKKTISKLIDNAKYIFKSRNRGRINRYFLKPIITLANRVDPGRLMPSKGVSEEFAKLMQEENKLKSTQLYNVKDCAFQVGNTRLTLTSGTKGTFNLRFGRGNRNINIPHGITAGTAKKSASDEEKLSKFLGDFMQILVAASNNGAGPVTHTMVIGTLDGIMSGMTCFIFKNILGQEPKLFIDMSYKQANQVYMFGVDNLIKTSRNVKIQNVPVVAESNIGSNIAPSPPNGPSRNRLTPIAEGSGNSSTATSRNSTSRNNGTRALAGAIGRLGGTPIQVVNGIRGVKRKTPNNANSIIAAALANKGLNKNKNKNKPPPPPPPTGGPNAQSGVGPINSIVGNKNNNLSNSGNSQPNANKPNNRSNLLAQIANLQARVARAEAAAIVTAKAANAAANAANAAAKKLQETRNASNAQAAKNAREKNAAAKNAAKEANAKAKKLARALKQLRTNAKLPGVSPNQRPRKSARILRNRP
jgi:hypothetical protein